LVSAWLENLAGEKNLNGSNLNPSKTLTQMFLFEIPAS